jgi:hypothetical protein
MEEVLQFDIAAGTPIPDKATAVAWCDGDLSQIEAIKQSVYIGGS